MRHPMRFIVAFALLLPGPCAAQVRLQGKVKINGNVTLRIPPMSLTSLSPDSAAVNTTVTINGTSFGGVPGTVDFGGVQIQPTVANWTNSCIYVQVPAGLPVGMVLVQVTVGGVNSNPLGFTVTPTPPSGSQISLLPNSGPVGTPVTITGMNFTATQGSVTFFNQVIAPSGSVNWSAASILVPVPSGSTTGNVVVTVGTQGSNPATFTVTPLITITGLSPSFGAVNANVTITGNNFGATQGTSTVKLNGTAMPVYNGNWSNSSITVTVPSTTTGPVVVTVGGYQSNPVTFTVTTSNPPACGS